MTFSSDQWPHDPRLDPFRDAVWELSRDNQVVAHLTTQVIRMRSFPIFWLKRESLWYQVNWLDGEQDRPEEDYGPNWYTVAELEQGKFTPDDDDDVLDARPVPEPQHQGLWAQYGPPA
ncbi:hypothetical protein AB0P21_19065 [Kribbella sp. NPDC056861]|uniref:hypothetical protein n=1 Tax=Kribbella sp. NPDC056861 TaxID=3154857 RepID=UPI003435FA07